MERTEISGNNLGFLMEDTKTTGQLMEFLKEGALFRSFGQVLRQVCPKEETLEGLAQGLAEITGEETESVARKVRNWRKGQNLPKNRETLFQICFVLKLSEREADKILGAASETGIHYRNPGELAYAYALRTGKSYGEARALREKALAVYEKGKRGKPPRGSVFYTKQIRNAFSQVEGEEEFFAFLEANAEKLGELHDTAWEKFTELLGYLTEPEGLSGEKERKYTMEEVAETYIRMNVPQTKKVSDYTLLQRMVKKYWPNESSLLNMRSRKEDVSRKVLLLLYLITEDFDVPGETEEGYYEVGMEEETDADTLLLTRLKKMDLFLDSYGMNLLDPGNPFDFLVLYAMKTQDGEAVSDRMQAVLDALFAEK